MNILNLKETIYEQGQDPKETLLPSNATTVTTEKTGGVDPEAFEKLVEDVKKIQENVKNLVDSKINNIEVLAVFVALFTFVSIEFQLVQEFSFFQFLLFSPLFAALLAFFVLVLHFTINDKPNWKCVSLVLALALLLVILGFSARVFPNLKDSTVFPITNGNININQVNAE